jgi:hypothetical protein
MSALIHRLDDFGDPTILAKCIEIAFCHPVTSNPSKNFSTRIHFVLIAFRPPTMILFNYLPFTLLLHCYKLRKFSMTRSPIPTVFSTNSTIFLLFWILVLLLPYCLFISDKVICLVYVDDTLFFSPNEDFINEVIDKLSKADPTLLPKS